MNAADGGMETMRTLLLILATCLLALPVHAQYSGGSGTTDDPLMAYQAFLAQHKDRTTSDLLAMHPPGEFEEQVGALWESVSYHELVDAACELTLYERALLEDNGFVVTERLRTDHLIDQMVFAWKNDLPLFISADAILHAWGVSHDRILLDVEVGVLYPRLGTLLSQMHAALPALAARYSAVEGMDRMLRDVDVYLTVARRLLQQSVAPHYADNTTEIDNIVGLIRAEQFATYPLFSESRKAIDFSQFSPRGHYAEHYLLKDYFRVMMWLGRIELYLLPPQGLSVGCPQQTPQDIQRQTIDAVLLLELMSLADVDSVHREMEDLFLFLIGEQDNVTPANLRAVLDAVGLQNAAGLLDGAKLHAFQDALTARAFATQRILSQVLQRNPSTPENIQPASAFMMFGQRFIIDSYITGNLVFDKIQYKDESVCRLFPSTLDVLFALGNNAAGDLLVPELNQYHYSSNLAALRYLVDAHDDGFWNSSVYNMWLSAIRALNPSQDRANLPAFMQTAAWSRQKMNTQLVSWTELRHNHVLYAKQSYSGWGECSTPCAYVEPYPELYQRLNTLAMATHRVLEGVPFSRDEYLKGLIVDYLNSLGTVTEMLATIARKELDGTALTPGETTFLQEAVYSDWSSRGCGPPTPPAGWYSSLTYGIARDPEQMVVDYHTTPSDGAGNPVGWVLHAGTGPADLAIVTARLPGAETAAFVGPVMSYYEYATTNFRRLTDKEWRETYLSQAARPHWVSSYLADAKTAREGNDSPKSKRKASSPQPFNGATDAVQSPTLNWREATLGMAHDVYFGVSRETIANATPGTPGIYRGRLRLETTTYAPGDLEWGKTYYWRIDEVNPDEPDSLWKGNIWSFTTADFSIVSTLDDFESYTDDEGSLIYETWIDGWENSTGSVVGYPQMPFTERRIVHGAKQSMPMDYNNVRKPWYSEAQRTWVTPQDWTIKGADTLTLYFRAKLGNGPERLYVGTEDGAGRIAVVVHQDGEAVLATEWQKWHIALTEVRAAAVDMAAVKKMVIGVGDRKDPKPGGTGRIYIDDIRLTKRVP
jgi:hypothetical protein